MNTYNNENTPISSVHSTNNNYVQWNVMTKVYQMVQVPKTFPIALCLEFYDEPYFLDFSNVELYSALEMA